MKIQKGMVKYKDRNDIVCVYGVTDDGKTYYFLNNDGKSFSNGNQIVSTELVEAIDPMYKSSKIGVVDSEGNVVIPCENKGIKPINDDVILVEKATPVTESVLQAIEHRSDSLHAAQLVSTPAQIKDNIYREMGNDGRFLFNDQFSEATVYDINGKNLVNDDVYSFIAINNDKLYLSKNLPDSPVVNFPLVEEKQETAEEVQEEVVEEATQQETIDVSQVNVPVDVVESALESQATNVDNNVIQENFDTDTHTPLENVNEGLAIPSADDFMAATNLGMPVVNEDTEVAEEQHTDTNESNDVVEDTAPVEENVDTVAEETVPVEENVDTVAEETVPIEENTEEVTAEETVLVEENVETTVFEEEAPVEETVEEVVEEQVAEEEMPVEETINETVEDNSEEIIEEVVEDFYEEAEDKPLAEEDIQSLLDETSMDLFNGTSLQIDSIVNGTVNDDLDSYSFIQEENANASLFDDVAKTMSGLIKQVKDLRATNANYEEIIDGLNADKAELQGKVTALEHQSVELSDRNRALENGVVKLKTRIEMLASKVHEKDETISSLKGELTELRQQTAGKAKLFSLMRDAQALVEESNVEDEDDYSFIKAA